MGKLVHDSITATELVRNLSAAIDKVRISGHSIAITKGTQTVAELSPPPKPGLAITELVGLLKSLPKLGDDASTMAEDLKNIRKQTKLPGSKWD